jgi:hypothetical protein
MEPAINPDGTKFENLRGNYFHANHIKTASTNGMNFKLISEKYVSTKEGESEAHISPHVSLTLLHDNKKKFIQIFVGIEGKAFVLS